MCTQEQLDNITKEIVREAKKLLEDRLVSVRLYGSYARGTFDNESDIDIMILADVTAEEASRLRHKTVRLTSRLGLEYDVVISLHIKDKQTFYEWLNVMPFYQNVIKEGIELSA